MDRFNWTDDKHVCYADGKKYYYIYPAPKFNENGKTYSEVATVWAEDDPDNSFTVPFHTKYDEVDLTTKKICENIELYLKEHQF